MALQEQDAGPVQAGIHVPLERDGRAAPMAGDGEPAAEMGKRKAEATPISSLLGGVFSDLHERFSAAGDRGRGEGAVQGDVDEGGAGEAGEEAREAARRCAGLPRRSSAVRREESLEFPPFAS